MTSDTTGPECPRLILESKFNNERNKEKPQHQIANKKKKLTLKPICAHKHNFPFKASHAHTGATAIMWAKVMSGFIFTLQPLSCHFLI